MTYLLGWKTQSNAYLAADSVLTGAASSIDGQSSFGERHICDGQNSVAERGLKIVVAEDLAIGLCGDFQLARNLAWSLVHSYRRLHDPVLALREMVVSNGPFPRGCEARLIVGWRGEPSPRLFSFNYDGACTVHEAGAGQGFQLGSASATHKGITWELLKRLVPLEKTGPGAHLTAALGILQSYGIHDYLLPNGVGGTFTGLCITSHSTSWQPDLLYLIDEPDRNIWPAIATCIRDQGLIVNSTVTNEPRVFMTDATGENDFTLWVQRWEGFAHSYIKNKQFDFVVLLGLKHHVIIVVEMRRASESKLIRFCHETAIKDGIDWFELNAQAISELRREFSNPEPDAVDFRFWFEPYKTGSSVESKQGHEF